MSFPATLRNEQLFQHIAQLGETGNLAGVLIHLNDTYLIDDRRTSKHLEIPSMSRIATLIATVREAVQRACGTDRVLVVHSGDFLSPSRLGQKFQGAPMVDVLRFLPVNYLTLGNHEFDFGAEVLADRLAHLAGGGSLAASDPPIGRVILANLRPPPALSGAIPLEEIVFWPPEDPLIAITGLVSEEVASAATSKYGFSFERFGSAASRVVDRMRARGVPKLVVLSHCSQSDDRTLASLLQTLCWRTSAKPLILGGHDHHIDYSEGSISKNLSNCRSVSVFLIPNDSLEWGARKSIERLESERSRTLDRETLRQLIDSAPRSEPDARYPEDADAVLSHLPDAVAKAMRRRLEVTSAWLRERGRDTEASDLREVYDYAKLSDDIVYNDETFSGRFALYAAEGDLDYSQDSVVQKLIDEWVARGASSGTTSSAPVLRDYTADTKAFDARDESLRTAGTDFGNLVVDCIRAATGVDVVLVNAGSFRIDMVLRPQITPDLLRDVFLFDGANALLTLKMTAAELRALLTWSDHEPGHGRVLQRTSGISDLVCRGGTLRIAIISFLLDDPSDADGYAKELARLRGVSLASLQEEMRARSAESGARLSDLISRGLLVVPYSSEVRFSLRAAPTPLDAASDEATDLICAYRTACAASDLPQGLWAALLDPEGNTPAQRYVNQLPPEVRQARDRLLGWATDQGSTHGRGRLFDLVERLRNHPEYFRSGIPYHSYLYAAATAVAR